MPVYTHRSASVMSLPLGIHQDNGYQSPSSNVRPVVIVFDSNSRHRHKRRPKLKMARAIASPQTFAFINISQPDREDEDSRRLIKTHVMQNFLQRAEKQNTRSKVVTVFELSTPKDDSLKSICACPAFRSTENSPQAPPSNLIILPIQMQPYMLKSMHDCASNCLFYSLSHCYSNTELNFTQSDANLMLPSKAKVTDSAWLPLIMNDAALFHAVLCISGLVISAISDAGLSDSLIERKNMLQSIRIVSARLPGDDATSDGTIATVLFMAKAEVSFQLYSHW